MSENLHIPFLLIVVLSTIYLKQCSACDLVPSNDGSCFELVATPYITTFTSQFGRTIEGASVNPEGDMFAVHHGTSETQRHQLGQVAPQQRLFYSDVNQNSRFGGIRFLNSKTAFVTDVTNHRVLQLNVGLGNVVASSEDFCSDSRMIQPNDLALSKTGTVYTTGMLQIADANNNTRTQGDIWSCLPDGTAKLLEVLDRTNGIDLSPDEQHLYVTETYYSVGEPIAPKIWKYSSNIAEGTIAMKTLFVDFAKLDIVSPKRCESQPELRCFDIDGMKTDIRGNLFVTVRSGARLVAIFSPQAELIGKITTNFPHPSNLEFGGPNGTTLFIVGQCEQLGKGCVDRIDLVTPGRSWSMLQASSAWTVFQINNNYLKTILIILQLFYNWTLRV